MGAWGPAAPGTTRRVTFPQRIERLLAEHRLEAAPFDDREIVGLWTRALTSYRDAGVAGLSEEGAFTRAYDAGRQAATTLLAAGGLRVRGQAHHYTVFYALAALEDPAVSQFGVELESVRQSRHMAVYDATADSAVLRSDREKLVGMLTRLFPAAHTWLTARRPSLGGKLRTP